MATGNIELGKDEVGILTYLNANCPTPDVYGGVSGGKLCQDLQLTEEHQARAGSILQSRGLVDGRKVDTGAFSRIWITPHGQEYVRRQSLQSEPTESDDVDEDQEARDIEWARLSNLIERGPYDQVAFVERIDSPELPEVISALANSNGGVVVVGYKHTGDAPKVSVTNLPEIQKYLTGVTRKDLDRFASVWRSLFRTPLPSLRLSEFEIRPGSQMVYIDVQASPEPVRLVDGRGYRRKHTKNAQTFGPSRSADETGKQFRVIDLHASDTIEVSDQAGVDDAGVAASKGDDIPVVSEGNGIHSVESHETASIGPSEHVVGCDVHFVRRASEQEVCLDVDKYAAALGTFLLNAKGEVCLGILGHWGRGKTFLAERLARSLRSKGYLDVFFSAWKYRSTPEIWVFLYETLRESVGNWFTSIPIATRAFLQRSGPLAIFATLLSFGLSLIGPVAKISWLMRLVQIIGLGGLGFLVLQALRFRASSIRFAFNLPGHRDKLGLQAAIGEDLKALLIGLIPKDYFVTFYKGWLWLSVLIGSYLLLVFGIACLIGQHVSKTEDDGTFYLGCLGLLLFAFLTVGILVACFLRMNCNRVLLIVDDIDRCPPSQILDVIESIILQLSDPEIGERLQVCVLAEESVLEKAIIRRYEHLSVTPTQPVEIKEADRIVCENLEKLFSAHILLPPISDTEFSHLFDSILIAARPKGQERKPLPSQAFEQAFGNFDQKRREEIAAMSPAEFNQLPDDVRQSWSMIRVEEYPISSEEEEALAKAARRFFTSNYPGTRGPRAARMFLLRYQLARQLLRHLDIQWSPDELTKALLRCSPEGIEGKNGESSVANVVHQVAAWRTKRDPK